MNSSRIALRYITGPRLDLRFNEAAMNSSRIGRCWMKRTQSMIASMRPR